jgi:iron complex outermembrane receptor protein
MPNRDYRNLAWVSNTHFSSALGGSAILVGNGDRPFGAGNFYGNYPSWERTRTWFASARQDLGKKTQAAFAFRRHADLFVLYRDRPEVFTNRHAVESYQAVVRHSEQAGRNTRLHFGIEGLRDSIVSTNLGSHARTTGAAYAAVDFRALGRFSFSAGLREQVYGALRSELSPSVAAGVWLSRRMKLRASASRAFRLPSYTDLYYHDPANQGSPDLRPERAWSHEAGLDWHASTRLRGSVTAFHRRETDGIDYVRRRETDIWRATNLQRLRFTGVEVTAAAGLARYHELGVSYTALNGSHVALEGLLSRYVFNYPVHSAVATWQGVLPGHWAGRVRVGAAQRLGRRAYAVADAYLARTRGRLRPFLQISNLSSVRYEEIPGVPMPGRGVVGGLEWVVFGPSK